MLSLLLAAESFGELVFVRQLFVCWHLGGLATTGGCPLEWGVGAKTLLWRCYAENRLDSALCVCVCVLARRTREMRTLR